MFAAVDCLTKIHNFCSKTFFYRLLNCVSLSYYKLYGFIIIVLHHHNRYFFYFVLHVCIISINNWYFFYICVNDMLTRTCIAVGYWPLSWIFTLLFKVITSVSCGLMNNDIYCCQVSALFSGLVISVTLLPGLHSCFFQWQWDKKLVNGTKLTLRLSLFF